MILKSQREDHARMLHMQQQQQQQRNQQLQQQQHNQQHQNSFHSNDPEGKVKTQEVIRDSRTEVERDLNDSVRSEKLIYN